jgi:hypothetical protein
MKSQRIATATRHRWLPPIGERVRFAFYGDAGFIEQAGEVVGYVDGETDHPTLVVREDGGTDTFVTLRSLV